MIDIAIEIGPFSVLPSVSDTPQVPGYKILSVVGRGAMATVYRAEHERLKKVIALKVMDPVVAEDEEYRERFLREARSSASGSRRRASPTCARSARGGRTPRRSSSGSRGRAA